jgi:FMN phosphatase YigB (HAD superfamily)
VDYRPGCWRRIRKSRCSDTPQRLVYVRHQRSLANRRRLQKPGCHGEIMEYFYKHKDSGVTSPSQVAIVGDRLMTDMMMANVMGSYGVWVRDGVAESGRPPNLVGGPDNLSGW